MTSLLFTLKGQPAQYFRTRVVFIKTSATFENYRYIGGGNNNKKSKPNRQRDTAKSKYNQHRANTRNIQLRE